MQKSRLIGALAFHLGMGACLGTALALVLILLNAANVLEMIRGAADPGRTMLVFVAWFAAMFGVGASFTGYIFHAMEQE